MEAAFVAELTETQQVFRAVAGAAEVFDLEVDRGGDRAGTCCDLLVRGELPRVVPDLHRDPRFQALSATVAEAVGAYVGVPLSLSDGRLYGTFCCVSRTADPTLDARDAKFMDLLAAMVAG